MLARLHVGLPKCRNGLHDGRLIPDAARMEHTNTLRRRKLLCSSRRSGRSACRDTVMWLHMNPVASTAPRHKKHYVCPLCFVHDASLGAQAPHPLHRVSSASYLVVEDMHARPCSTSYASGRGSSHDRSIGSVQHPLPAPYAASR